MSQLSQPEALRSLCWCGHGLSWDCKPCARVLGNFEQLGFIKMICKVTPFPLHALPRGKRFFEQKYPMHISPLACVAQLLLDCAGSSANLHRTPCLWTRRCYPATLLAAIRLNSIIPFLGHPWSFVQCGQHETERSCPLSGANSLAHLMGSKLWQIQRMAGKRQVSKSK
jgi:hypothetical protein